MMPQEYFSALVYATSDGTAETFLAGVLHATGAPPPRSHPPPSLAAHWLGLIAEQVTITVPMLAALNLAESVEPPFQLPFLQGLYAAFCEAAPPDLLPKAVLQGDADTGTANTPAVYRGTVNGKVGYWQPLVSSGRCSPSRGTTSPVSSPKAMLSSGMLSASSAVSCSQNSLTSIESSVSSSVFW